MSRTVQNNGDCSRGESKHGLRKSRLLFDNVHDILEKYYYVEDTTDTTTVEEDIHEIITVDTIPDK